MLRSVLAVLVGYLAMSFLVLIVFSILGRLLPGSLSSGVAMPPVGSVVGILAFGFLAAMTGGFVTASMAQHAEAKHVYALMGFMVLMGLLSIRQYSSQPLWYPLALLGLGPLGAYLGGRVGILRKSAPDIE